MSDPSPPLQPGALYTLSLADQYTLTAVDHSIPISNPDPILRCFFPGDILTPSPAPPPAPPLLLHSRPPAVTQSLKHIVGILCSGSKVRHSVDKHGVQTASFKPLDPSLPDFQVPCKWGFTEKNRLLVIEFIDWKASIKRPQGALKCDLGWVGDAQAESRALQLHYRPPFAPKRAVDEATAQLVEMAESGAWKEGRAIASDGNIVTIDPPGCRDADDAFSLEKAEGEGADVWRLAVHIADLSPWTTDRESLLVRQAAASGSTLYLSEEPGFSSSSGGSNIPMFPYALSEGCFSLLQGHDRPTLTLSVLVDVSANRVLSCSAITPTICRVTHSLTYDNCVDCLAVDWKALDSIAHALRHHMKMSPKPLDPHTWIEALMLFYNHSVASAIHATSRERGLYINQPPPILTLAHAEVGAADGIRLAEAEATTLQRPWYMNADIVSPASYALQPLGHSSLGIDLYTHASSPIRRFADVLVQQLLMGVHGGVDDDAVARLNLQRKRDKRFYRDQLLLMAMVKCWKDESAPVEALVIRDSEEVDGRSDCQKARVYIDEWKFVSSIVIYGAQQQLKAGATVSLNYFTNAKSSRWKRRVIFQVHGWQGDAVGAAGADGDEE